jgi:hypothetical protein
MSHSFAFQRGHGNESFRAHLVCLALIACSRPPPDPTLTPTPPPPPSHVPLRSASSVPPAAGEWVSIAKGPSLEVSVERALYELSGAPHFFVHVRLTNLGPRTIGLDLRREHGVFYPNQWGASDELHRGVIDEARMLFPPLDDAARTGLAADFRAGVLARAARGATVEYYVEFNASSRADVDEQARGYRFILVAMDGVIRWSDGSSAEQVRPPDDDDAAREVTVPAPVVWRSVPSGALVVRD